VEDFSLIKLISFHFVYILDSIFYRYIWHGIGDTLIDLNKWISLGIFCQGLASYVLAVSHKNSTALYCIFDKSLFFQAIPISIFVQLGIFWISNLRKTMLILDTQTLGFLFEYKLTLRLESRSNSLILHRIIISILDQKLRFIADFFIIVIGDLK